MPFHQDTNASSNPAFPASLPTSSLAVWLDALADAPVDAVPGILDEGLAELGAQVSRASGRFSVSGPDEALVTLRMAQAVMRARGLDAAGLPGGQDGVDPTVHRTALGVLTSGLSHEINNPLAAVIANLDLGLREVEDQLRSSSSYSWLDELKAELEDARVAADQLHRIVRRLRPLGPRNGAREETDLGQVLDASLVLLGRELRRRGRLRHPPPTETNSVVRPSPHLTMHAVLGQFLHVLHALPAGADQREIAIQVETRHHNAVQLSVIARPGVPAVQYGPAQVSRRLALGLAEDAGAIFMEGPSDEEEWSCSLEIPLRLEATPSTLPRRQQADRVGRVLVIDDEPLIGKLVSRILSGHDVVVAHDGSTGLARARREAWDLVLLDSNLPDLPGDVIAAELTALDPSKADGVVRMSGGVLEASNDRPVLRKPFEPQALRALLNMRLDRR